MSRSTQKNLVRFFLRSFGALIVGATSVAAHAQCAQYAVDIIPGPVCKILPDVSSSSGLNEAGELCGAYGTCNGGFAALWLGDGWWTAIPVPAEFDSLRLNDINIHHQLAATVDVPNTPTYERAAFIDFDAGIVLNLGLLPGSNMSFGHAINRWGTVCGLSMNSNTGPRQAFIWQSGKMSALNLPIGPNSEANDIADSGSICGWMGASQSIAHGFIWAPDGTVIDIGLHPGDQSSNATALNNLGNVCGRGRVKRPREQTLRGFFWSNGAFVDLGLLPGHDRCVPEDINDSNVVVGLCTYPPAGASTGFIWRDGVMTALNDLIDPALGLNINSAQSINNAGQIAGGARVIGSSDAVAVRLTPIPTILGDYNCDRVVDLADLLGVVEHWEYDTPNADFNKDGIVNVPDLLIVIQNWTPPTPPR